MDLETVRNRLESGYYLAAPGRKEVEEVIFDAKSFEADMRLIFENARTYNSVGDFYYESATRLLEKFESRMAHMPSMEQISTQVVKKSKKRKKIPSAPIDVDRPIETKKLKNSTSGAAAADTATKSTTGKKKKVQGSMKGKTSAKTIAKKKKPPKPAEEDKKEGKKSMTIEEMETRLRALRRQRTVNEAGSPASPAPGGASYLLEAKALYHVPMTFEEKLQLSKNVSKLPSDKLSKIVALATKNAKASMEVNHNEEIELDIDSLDNEVLRDMEAYVTQELRKKKKGDPNTDIFEMSNKQVVAEIESLTTQLRKSSKGKSPALLEGNVKDNEKSFYDSDSSSDSDDSDGSGSSGYESSSEESDSSGGEEADLLRRRRERNLAHQQAMQAAGTPLPSPSYHASGR
eukprot:gb/GEZJ01001662.1/.p2 GENE.gb/GEZJ01001662.1/~~gb/GEZJ01001662.1/.p2  ORF type:complete len:403 (-),score=85.36 gb/GEZJ01001662.1/:2222-3430(-)